MPVVGAALSHFEMAASVSAARAGVGCFNPACRVLGGKHEALQAGVRACGACGLARYCCAACQREDFARHWRAGCGRCGRCVRRARPKAEAASEAAGP